eukprot:GGOE01001579.1.p1 GENE.GGOE01001579.1~~GGOE01001579.1.p1  ORF type:complete len:620 (-),score=131.55 GGOE01001579.1:366-2159(-)
MAPWGCFLLLLLLLQLSAGGSCCAFAVGVLSLSEDAMYLRYSRPWFREAGALFFGTTEARGLAMVSCPCPRAALSCWVICTLQHLMDSRPLRDWYVIVAETSFLSVANLQYNLEPYAPGEPWAVADFSLRLRGRPPRWPTDADFLPQPCAVAFSHNATTTILQEATRLQLDQLALGPFYRTLAQKVGIGLLSADSFLCAAPLHADEADDSCHAHAQGQQVRCVPSMPNPVVYRPAVLALGPREQFASFTKVVLRRMWRLAGDTSAVCGPTGCSLCSASRATGVIRHRDRALRPHHCNVDTGLNRTLWSTLQGLLWSSSGRRSTPVRLVDVFLFTTELDMLEVKLYESFEAVGLFVVMESNTTFQGQPRPLVFPPWRNHPRFARFSRKIRYLTFSPTQQCEQDAWACELEQRTHSVHRANLQANDLVMVTDADEIISLDVMRRLRDCNHLTPIAMELTFFYYSVRLHRLEEGWQVPAYTRWQAMRVTGLGLRRTSLASTLIRSAGWHFSYFGGPAVIHQKLLSFSHTEYSRPPYTDLDHIEQCVRTGADLFNRTGYRWIASGPHRLPALLHDRPCDFPAFFDPFATSHPRRGGATPSP